MFELFKADSSSTLMGVLPIVGQMDDRLSTYFLQIHSSIYRTLTLAILRNSRTKLLSTFSSSVRLETETKRPLSLPNTSATVVKWKEQLETQMRRDLISNLDSLYSCVVEGTDVNHIVKDFSEDINNVLGKYCNHNCELLYKKYLKGLEEFNKHHSEITFNKLNNSKRDYKKLQKKLKTSIRDSKVIWYSN